MRRRPVVTILMLIIAMILTAPLRAQQKSVGPSGAGPRPNAVRPYVWNNLCRSVKPTKRAAVSALVAVGISYDGKPTLNSSRLSLMRSA
jgi:hypothetical protein